MIRVSETNIHDERELLTGEYVRLRYVLASPMRRLIALMVDIGVLMLLNVYFCFKFNTLGHELYERLPIILQMVFIAMNLMMNLFCEYLFGRTLGKRLVGITVISSEGVRPNFVQAFLRWLLFPVDCCGVGLVLIDIKGGRLGDLAADCLVVDSAACRRNLSVDKSFDYAMPDYEPRFPDAGELSDDEVFAIRSVLYDRRYEVYLERVANMLADRLPSVAAAGTMGRDDLERVLQDYAFFSCQSK